MSRKEENKKLWLSKIDPENLSFYWGTLKKKETFGESYLVNSMPFDSSLIEDLSDDKKWEKLESIAFHWLVETGELPSFAKEQDYERTGGCSYASISFFTGMLDIVKTKDVVDTNFKMTVDEGVFEKIIIPKEFKQKIIEAITQLKEYKLIFEEWGFGEKIKKGKGVNLLFSGASGTGKTYCGEIIAEYVGLPFELVSVASIESKWVGESEKNISNLFKSLNNSDKILILDEVDSFLTSRSKGDNGSPHYNKLTNQFLVELERHNGICVMTTNRPVILDRALQRRIDVVLDFPEPDAEARERIWKHHIPSKAPVDKDIDFSEIAKVELNGGQIKNAIMEAARKAALGDKRITKEMLLSAAKNESSEAKTLSSGKDHSK